MREQQYSVPGFEKLPEQYLVEAAELFNERFASANAGHLGDHLVAVYKLIDKINAEFVAQFATCSKGCAHCCRMDVQITTLEAEYISLETGIQLSGHQGLTDGHTTPCPFVSESGACSVYACRPLFCRTYHSLSEPRLCGVQGAAIWQYGAPAGDMSNPVFKHAAMWLHAETMAAGGTVRDIRDWFPQQGK